MSAVMQYFRAVRADPVLRHAASLLFDLAGAGVALAAAYLTAHGYPGVLRVPSPEMKIGGFLACAMVSFLIFAPYRGSWRYVSLPDLMKMLKGAALAVAIYTIGAFLLTRGENVPRSVPVLTFIYMVAIFAGARLGYRMLVERTVHLSAIGGGNGGARRTVLLCGFTDKAESFLRNARRSGGFAVAGILDDVQTRLGRTIQGVSVLGGIDDLDAVLSKLRRQGIEVRELVVTENAPSRQRLAHILEVANANSIKVSRIPDPTEVAEVTSDFLLEPKPIEIEDLLERPEVKADLERVASLIAGRDVTVTGAGGSIGSELSRQIAALSPRRLVISDSSEFLLYMLDKDLRAAHPGLDIVTRIVDVRDPVRVSHLVSEFRPEVVFHAAALKHVPMMEENPLEAIKTNVLGTRNVADAALANGVATFVMISTDKVVNPTSIMGATKRAAEAYCQALDLQSDRTRFRTVRFGNVLGSNGSVVPRFREQIAAGGPVTVTHPEIVRYFMTIPEAVRLVLNASAHGLARNAERGKIMVLDMGSPVRIADLAERMIQLAGYRPGIDIDIAFTGLRPGEKLYEELFDPSEVPDERTDEGYVVASPRIIDRHLLERRMAEIAACAQREDEAQALDLLRGIVPEYRDDASQAASGAQAEAEASLRS